MMGWDTPLSKVDPQDISAHVRWMGGSVWRSSPPPPQSAAGPWWAETQSIASTDSSSRYIFHFLFLLWSITIDTIHNSKQLSARSGVSAALRHRIWKQYPKWNKYSNPFNGPNAFDFWKKQKNRNVTAKTSRLKHSPLTENNFAKLCANLNFM